MNFNDIELRLRYPDLFRQDIQVPEHRNTPMQTATPEGADPKQGSGWMVALTIWFRSVSFSKP